MLCISPARTAISHTGYSDKKKMWRTGKNIGESQVVVPTLRVETSDHTNLTFISTSILVFSYKETEDKEIPQFLHVWLGNWLKLHSRNVYMSDVNSRSDRSLRINVQTPMRRKGFDIFEANSRLNSRGISSSDFRWPIQDDAFPPCATRVFAVNHKNEQLIR